MSLKLAPYEERDPATTCVGPPSGKGLFEGAQKGNSPCNAMEQCQYFDTVAGAYSSEGCETVALTRTLTLTRTRARTHTRARTRARTRTRT